MLITIERLLDPGEVRLIRRELAVAAWEDGAGTAGTLASRVKRNQQLPENAEPGRSLGHRILARLGRHPTFLSAALPRRLYPPRFNRYVEAGRYGAHVDAAVMVSPESGETLRSDLSATLFLSDPAGYDGGELQVEGTFGVQAVKLQAGDLVLYPSSSLHRVTPVTRGERLAAILWVESLVARDGDRALLFDLDQAVQALTARLSPDDGELVRLSGIYHNLLRRWAAT